MAARRFEFAMNSLDGVLADAKTLQAGLTDKSNEQESLSVQKRNALQVIEDTKTELTAQRDQLASQQSLTAELNNGLTANRDNLSVELDKVASIVNNTTQTAQSIGPLFTQMKQEKQKAIDQAHALEMEKVSVQQAKTDMTALAKTLEDRRQVLETKSDQQRQADIETAKATAVYDTKMADLLSREQLLESGRNTVTSNTKGLVMRELLLVSKERELVSKEREDKKTKDILTRKSERLRTWEFNLSNGQGVLETRSTHLISQEHALERSSTALGLEKAANEKRVKDLQAEKATHDQHVNDLKAEKAAHDQQVETLKTEKAAAQDTKDAFNKQATEWKKWRDRMLKSEKTVNQRAEGLTTKERKLLQDTESLKRDQTQLAQERQHVADMTALTKRMTDLAVKVDQSLQVPDEGGLKFIVDNLKAANGESRSKLDTALAERDDLQRRLNEAEETHAADIQNRQTELSAAVTKTEQFARDLSRAREDLTAQKTDSDKELQLANVEIEKLKVLIGSDQTKSHLQNSLAKAEDVLAKSAQDVKDSKANGGILQQKISELEQDLSNSQAQVSVELNKCSQLQGNNSDLQAAVNIANASIDHLHSEIAMLMTEADKSRAVDDKSIENLKAENSRSWKLLRLPSDPSKSPVTVSKQKKTGSGQIWTRLGQQTTTGSRQNWKSLRLPSGLSKRTSPNPTTGMMNSSVLWMRKKKRRKVQTNSTESLQKQQMQMFRD